MHGSRVLAAVLAAWNVYVRARARVCVCVCVCVCVSERQKEKALSSRQYREFSTACHLNVSKTTIKTATLLFVCTSERDRARTARTTAKDTARLAGRLSLYPLQIYTELKYFVICKTLFILRKRVFRVVGLCGCLIPSRLLGEIYWLITLKLKALRFFESSGSSTILRGILNALFPYC
jgi:hypothetical protein